jgi:hypothetical protein
MPDNQGKLSPEEKTAVIDWLFVHWKNQDCPFHGPTGWEIGDTIATSPFAGTGGGAPGSGFQFGGPTYPLIVVTCAICGYTVLVNAIKLGIVKMGPELPESPPLPGREPTAKGE